MGRYFPGRIVEKVKSKGLGYTLGKAAVVAVSPVYRSMKLYLIAHDLSEPIPDLRIPPGYEHLMITKAELSRLGRLVDAERLARYEKRLDDGMFCFALAFESEVVSFFWYSMKDVVDDILGFRVSVGRDEVYSFDTYTDPAHRRRKLFFSLLVYHLHIMKAVGMKKVIAIHSAGDIKKVFPKYREVGIPARIEKTLILRRVLLKRSQKWLPYDGHLKL